MFRKFEKITIQWIKLFNLSYNRSQIYAKIDIHLMSIEFQVEFLIYEKHDIIVQRNRNCTNVTSVIRLLAIH